ncbi:MAG TPA: sulfatase [Planctomycetota bacterium]
MPTHRAALPTNHGARTGSVEAPRARALHLVAGLLALVGLAAPAPAQEPVAAPARPSFVLIVADDLGWSDVGFHGSRGCATPRLDALAQAGLVFTQACSGAPTCSPARAALLTGKAPARLRLTDSVGVERAGTPAPGLTAVQSRQKLGLRVPTLASELHRAGYHTALIGKWHLGTDPREHGFDEVRAWIPGGAVPSHFETELEGLDPPAPGQHLTERLTRAAVTYLEARGDEPFLLVLSHYAPHTPLEAPAEEVARARERAEAAGVNPTYAALVSGLDASVGAVQDALVRLGRTERTLLVFTSDNGGLLEHGARGEPPVAVTTNAPLRGGKHGLYEGGLRVPLVLWGGPVARRGTVATPVVAMDLLPTLLGLAGLPAPAPLDGVDLAPLLAAGGALPSRALYFHYPHRRATSAVRRGDEKLVHAWSSGTSELYDLAADPGETRDLAGERPQRVRELESELRAWLTSVGADVPVRTGR